MGSVNKAIVIGNAGKDPETKYTDAGVAVCTMVLATKHSWKQQDGTRQEKTEWHRVVFSGKLAEIAGEYLKKGSQVYVEGKLETRKWTDQSGQEKYTTEIVVDSFNGVMQMIGSAPQAQGQQQQQTQQRPQQQGGYAQASGGTQRPQQQMQQQPQGGYQDFDQSIPF